MSLAVEFGAPLPPLEIDAPPLLLRAFTLDDLELVHEASADDFIPKITTVPNVWTPEAGRAFIDRQNSRLSDGYGWSLAIVDTTTNRAIGQIGLWITHLSKGRAEIGYWIAPSGRGGGAAAAAVAALSEWAFEQLDVDRLSLFIEPWNTASIRTAERAGFEREGLLKKWERVDGIARDMYSFVRARPTE